MGLHASPERRSSVRGITEMAAAATGADRPVVSDLAAGRGRTFDLA